ncbi:MAG TPA: hypothetical protein VG248_09885 [Caulobacteraceae bacterium]|jgi:hypothetical protein|nr:hypothetical protein [Caulobacteraceae bacterium]
MILAALPLLLAPVLAYAALIAAWGGWTGAHAHERLGAPLAQFAGSGGAVFSVSAADLLLALALVTAFLDLMRSGRDRRAALINHAFSVGLFCACLAGLFTMPGFQTSTFVLISLMVLLDLAAGLMSALGLAREGDALGR